MPERVAVFIDKEYVHRSVEHLMGPDFSLCWESFVELLVENRWLLRAYFYDAKLIAVRDPQSAGAQQRLLDRLRFTPYFDVRLGRLTGDPPRQKGVDLLLAVDMLKLAMRDAYDTAILATGDGDFTEIVREVQTHGKHIELIYFSNCSYELKMTADMRRQLTDADLNDLPYSGNP